MRVRYVVLADGKELFNTEEVNYELLGFDENGEPILKEERVIPDTEEELVKLIERTILRLKKKREEEIFDRYGYDGLDDVMRYAELEKAGVEQGDEAQKLLLWRDEYDTQVWSYIDGLQTKTKEELKQDIQDLVAVEGDIFNKSVQTVGLP